MEGNRQFNTFQKNTSKAFDICMLISNVLLKQAYNTQIDSDNLYTNIVTSNLPSNHLACQEVIYKLTSNIKHDDDWFAG